MNTNRIDATAKTNTNRKAEALAARLRYTAMAGAAAMVLAGGAVAPANAAVEVFDDVKVEEKKRTRFADVAGRLVTSDVIESRKNLAQALQSLDDQAKLVKDAGQLVATKESLANAASKQLTTVTKEEAQKWFFKDKERVKNAETEKRDAEGALKAAQDSLADAKNVKSGLVIDAVKESFLGVLADKKKSDIAELRAKVLMSLQEDNASENLTGVPDSDNVVEGTDAEMGTETSTETNEENGAKTVEPAESGREEVGGIDENSEAEDEAGTDSESETSAREDETGESGQTDEAIEGDVDSRESQPTEVEVTQPAFSAEQAMASGVVLTQMANAAQQNAELFRKGMQDRVSGDDAFMQPVDIATAGTGISTWAQAMGGQTTTQGRGDLAGFSVRGAGMVAGVDVKKNNTRVGVAVGYGDANVDANGENGQNASSKVSTYSVGLYGAHEVDGWFANGGVSYSAHSIKSQRAAKLGGEVYGLSAKTNATTVGGFAQFGKHIVTNAVNIDPSITLKVSNTSVKGFTENGDAGLKVDGSNFNSARVGIGARLWKEFGDASHSVTPSLRISYERELAHAAPSMDVALANAANAGTMTVMGNKLGRDILSAEAGIDVKFGKKLSLRGGVNGSVRQGQTQAGVAGSLKYVW
ncbi:autotransporter outer membrane beta-barrel domain-containing protein [Pandoraea fibrosis]|uniref:Outer membrane autotransporter barrel domain-containing protein n=1 Tax=Pandoraea fibrosis TaxID=1891094 RepID=A0A5E4YMU0_9BURK|nr:autotransporter outer membrane beta-barrel domain-containing protein [Pandoraea fibrosis]VVE49243.1 outer membrane autotransporter barrel domain-containing protein [Pandoraea fibrosis]